MAEEKKEEKQIYDGVGCPADTKSEKTIYRPHQRGSIIITKSDGTKEEQRVIPPHSTNHGKVRPNGMPIREDGDTTCDEVLGPVVRREPPKTDPHPEKKELEKEEQNRGFRVFG